MTAEEKKILEVFKRVIPKLSENEKYRLLGRGEGMEIKIEEKKEKQTA